MGKIKDLKVVTGSYEKNGETKKSWKTIGALMEGQNGQYLMIDRTFNPAGVPVKDGQSSIMVSLFDPRDDDAPKQSSHDKAKADGYQSQKQSDLEDGIPFS